MASDIDLCNRALLRLGADPISGFTDAASDAARICGAIYPPLVLQHLSKYPWGFAKGFTALTRDAVATVDRWTYSFQMPPDRAAYGAWAVYPSGSENAAPLLDWEVFGNRICANVDELWAQYTRAVTEEEFPPYFEAFIVEALGADIAFAITDQQNTADTWAVRAYGSADRDLDGGLLLDARITDAQAHPSPVIEVGYDLIEARY